MFLLRVAFIIWWVYNTLFIFREKRWFFGLKYVWRWWHDMYFLCDLFSLSQFLFICEKHEAQVPQVFLTFIFNNWYTVYNRIPSVEVFVHWHAFRRHQELNFKTIVHIYHTSIHSEIYWIKTFCCIICNDSNDRPKQIQFSGFIFSIAVMNLTWSSAVWRSGL